jgi:hypothetical protein
VNLPVLGVCMIALSIAMYAVNRFAKARCALVFFGIMIAGLTGFLVTFAARLMAFLATVLGVAGAKIVGVSGGAIIAAAVVVGLFLLLHDMHPKGSGKKRTYHLAWILGLGITLGLMPWAALNNLPQMVQQGITTNTIPGR